jgi:hypothetical protein
MANNIRTVDFLPEIFQTPVNRQFLNATLDQLVQEPKFQKTQGYVGRRVGSGVNPADKYVVEPTKSRNDYQLEPGVVSLQPDTNEIQEAITYPGINDALKLQGAFTNNANRLYNSEYYTWDPFVDFDKFVNYAQYYWLPGGPLDVDVFAKPIPLTNSYTVTRANGAYTFNDARGNDPTLTLLRGGSYQFNVAQNVTETVTYRISNNGPTAYIINSVSNPTLQLIRGNTYVFQLNLSGIYPLYIKTEASLGINNQYTTGVTNNGSTTGTITFTVPQDAPDTLYYCNSVELTMRGQFDIVDASPGTGPKFWIQAEPGVDGVLPYAPNISSRDVLGVSNNGIDLGTVTFDVPLSTAQSFYYSLNNFGSVDLATNLLFDQINNIPVADFINTYGGIDGIVNLQNLTLIFTTTADDGWDNIPIGNPSGTTSVPESERYGLWRIQYVTVDDVEYIQLVYQIGIANLNQLNILFGTQWASTNWYKNIDGYFEEIPLLTAVKNVLYYQDGQDPAMFGQIRLLDQDQASTIFIADILGKKDYTSPNGVVFTNGLKVNFIGSIEPASYQNNSYYVEGVGTAIQLLPITDFVTPETYTKSQSVPYDSLPYDIGNFDSTLNAPEIPDYLTINRASPDLNAWSRSNRWFHIDVIYASAAYNNTSPLIDNALRARRPILEFRAGTRLFNFGTQGKIPVDIIDFDATDALSTINGTASYTVDGYEFVNGTRVIFAADEDPQVRNQIYQVQFITPDTVAPLIDQPVINLVPASDSTVVYDDTVVCMSGATLQGKSFWFDGIVWYAAQEKTGVNQAPLFDVYDSAGISFADRAKYPSSTFEGSKLFSYATSNTTPDTILGFPLRYLSLANVGDIVFDNNLYTDTFTYVTNSIGSTVPVSNGFVREYIDRTTYTREIGWQSAVTPSLVRQQFQFMYDGSPLKLDVAVDTNNVVPAVQLFVNGQFQGPSTYTYTTTANTTIITFVTPHVPGDVIEVDVLSSQISTAGFYQVPINLENNPLNANSPTFTLGTIRTHYTSIGQNLLALEGPVIGPNNTRDLGNIIPYGLEILQQSAPLTLAGYFMRSTDFDIFSSLEYNSREYIKYKSLLLETVIRNEYDNMTAAEILDSAIAEITTGRTSINPFYWSDMLPSGPSYTETDNLITPITTPVFNTVQTYDFTSSNYLGLLVYLTRDNETVLLERDVEYEVSVNSPRITVTVPLQTNDTITTREYSNTAGNFCPNTPTKLGLYPKFRPELFLDTNYVQPTFVIQGHDGSITTAFGDIRDEVLLEFEKRIYDNLKTDNNPIPLTFEDVAPGFFRTTDYTQTEITNILSESFLSWVGWNKLNYKQQDYLPNNPFTYNYSSAGNKVNNAPLLGAWRGIYRYFYDTTSPNFTPWEMLGLTEQPSWWENRYGPAPYTADNLVLWDDLANGLVMDPVVPYISPNYIRPGLQDIIPNGTEGQLLSPFESVVGQYDPNAFQKSWAVGDGGPVEASWWSSSSYPFAVMRLLALTRPAEFFTLFADRDLYKYDYDLGQYLYNGRYRLDANGIQVYGNGTSKASYINWIVDYNQQLGINSSTLLEKDLANLDVRLCYRMASFTDKQYLKIYVERSSPNSTNSSLLLPDDSYNLLLYKNQPFDEIIYSGLIIEKTIDGYAVYGYNNTKPYFEILASATNGLLTTITSGGVTVRVPTQYTQNIVQVPYGYVFTNNTMVVDFILSYGEYLKTAGLIFDDQENGYTLNWGQMANEFLYWGQQGWGTGTIINLNPAATTLKAYRPGAIIDTIVSTTPENMLLDQNRQTLPTRDLIVQRDDDSFSVTSTNNQTISYLHLKFTNYENMVVLDNVSIFNDLIYDPTTAARQNRVRIVAATTTEWNGQLNAPGFILNQNNVKEWQPNRKYTKGEVVLYKNNYWQAAAIVQPKLLFDYTDWYKSNYALIQEGLLPNIANKADQLANSYNTNSANLERDNDLLSYGLIGFRPRQYMTDLNLDDVSQVNLYQQFLGTKGTIRSAELFANANLGKETGEYSILENWGVLVSTYGANANKSFFELRLNEAFLKANPCTVQVINPGQTSQANQSILLNDIWRESYKLTSPEILPTTYAVNLDTALPSAGYVNLDDVDITVFSLDDPTSLAANIDSVGVGTTIWVAKSNAYDWNVYRCGQIPGQLTSITDNLNSTSIARFTKPHNLSVGDLIILRYFNTDINGVYRVLSVPSITTITIAYSFVSSNQTTINGTGLAFYLQSMRVDQPSDVASLPYANDLVSGARAYIDNNGSGHWEVIEKQNPFTSLTILQPPLLSGSNFYYGRSTTQSYGHRNALVGSPGQGLLYAYLNNSTNTGYVPDGTIELNAPEVSDFGNAVEFGYQNWVVAGANTSWTDRGYAVMIYYNSIRGGYQPTQLLLAPDQNYDPIKFGSSAMISQNERWMYIGAPEDTGRVYAYGRVDIELQSISYTTEGSTSAYEYSSALVIDYNNPDQLIVTLNNNVAIYGIDYTIDENDVIFTTPPAENQELVILRRQAVIIDKYEYYNIEQDSTTGVGSGAEFTITVLRGTYVAAVTTPGTSYAVGDELVIDGTQIGGATPANDLTIVVDEVSSGGISGFTVSGSGIDDTDVFSLTPYLYTATEIEAFTVFVDGEIQRLDVDYEFTPSTQELTFLTNPAAGAEITVSSNTYWKYIDTLTVSGINSDAQVGFSVSTTLDGRQVVVGAVRATVGPLTHAGAAYVFDRSAINYQVTDATVDTYEIPGSYTNPVAILVNNQFLTIHDLTEDSVTTTQFVSGQVDIDLDAGTFTILSTLTVGDVITVETNQFQIVDTLTNDSANDESQFGYSVAISPNNCTVFVGAPSDNIFYPSSGTVQRSVNQSQVYGSITSTVANPTLTPGDTLRINNYEVAVPAAGTIASLVLAINTAKVPNAVATLLPNAEFIANGSTQIFDLGTVYTAASAIDATVVYVNNVLQTSGVDYTYNNSTAQLSFVTAPGRSSIITVVPGRMTISVKNMESADPADLVSIAPGTVGSAFADLGFDIYSFVQTITSPAPGANDKFGSSISIDTDVEETINEPLYIVIGVPHGNAYEPTTFDLGKTYFDDRSTIFSDTISDSGVVYTYDYLPSATTSVNSPGEYVFGQQIYSTNLNTNDEFGYAISYTNGRLLVGAPNSADGTTTSYFGFVDVFDNPDDIPSWKVIHAQQPVVDVDLINGVFMYDKLTSSTQTYFDFFDPLQGKILGAARRNIDFIGAVDPANYNTGAIHNFGNSWGSEHVGEIWWDTDTVRFIDPNQDDIVYASRRWGQTFPGSRVDIYQWIASDVPPVSYTGVGTPLSTVSYTVRSALNEQNVFVTTYYFWVRNINTINTNAGKTLSTVGISQYILSPRSSGIPYIAALNASTIAIYNGLEYISAADTILHIDFDRELTDAVVHTEYELIADGDPDGFLSPTLYRKLLDSFCGSNSTGAVVPDPALSPAERYGVEFRPRQSMFANRFMALENYLGRSNTILAQYPIVEMRSFRLLNSAEPIPPANSGAWDMEVANLEELGYQDIYSVAVGYKYLVDSVSTQNGLWGIYEVSLIGSTSVRELVLIRVQNYDTPRYWNYINWYLPGYNSTVQPISTVPNYSALLTLTINAAPVGSSVKVAANAQGKWEIYLRLDTGWERVGLQDGTIEFSETLWNYELGGFGFDVKPFDTVGFGFDFEPSIETRKILEAINEELFIDDLVIVRNQLLILMFNFIYSEFTFPNWLIKTSLVDVNHKIRALLPFQSYLQDNQTFVLDYIQEVKPYHVQIREFNLTYYGEDAYAGQLTDFDIPAYWNTSLEIPQYTAPVLTPYTDSGSTVESFVSDTPSNSTLWTLFPYNEWFNNYLLSVDDITIVDGGVGYTSVPAVTITGDCVVPAELEAVINSAGYVVGMNIINPGSGYSTTPTITISGGGGAGARAYPVMGNGLVRNIKTTLKYDRYQYYSDITNWQANVTYLNGVQVRYANRVWAANNTTGPSVSSATFNPENWTLIEASTLSGIDRTKGFYTPTVNEPGLDLGVLIDGITYPGVQVYGLGFDENNIPLNTIYESFYGIRDPLNPGEYLVDPEPPYPPTNIDVNVDGGAYVDTYESHAPEELIPSSEFDTLDFRVYTTPGSDWSGDGHGFPAASIRYVYDSASPTYSFAGLLTTPFTVMAFNVTTGYALEPESYDWANYELTLSSDVTDGDVISLYVTGIGGGNQLYVESYIGSEIIDGNTLSVPFPIDAIYEFCIYNGEIPLVANVDYTSAAGTTNNTIVTFANTYDATNRINIAALGYAATGTTYSWSMPVFETIVVDDSAQLTYTLINSVQGTNPVNLEVLVNGLRARPSEGIQYIGDDSTVVYNVAPNGGYPTSLIANNDVSVYVNDTALTLGVDFVVDPATGFSGPRSVTLTTPPARGDVILIAVRTAAQYWVSGNQLTFRPSAGLSPTVGDVIEIITWNDTNEQDLLTQVFVGPDTQGITITEGYDSTVYSPDTVDFDPGSYDYSEGDLIQVNSFDTGRPVIDPERIMVSLNGKWLFDGSDYTVSGQYVLLTGPIIGAADVVVITSFTQSVIPGAMAFRIFQDMRGVQATYRITAATTTYLEQELLATDDVIHVDDASKLSEPNLDINIWGIITINGERIMYRERNVTNNTISSLLRGTAGTAAADHPIRSDVYDMGLGNLMPLVYQNYVVSSTSLGDASTTTFIASGVNISNDDSTIRDETVEVYVGGIRVLDGFIIVNDAPVEIEFDEAPPAGVEVTILVRRGVTWYQRGFNTASDGVPLQDTNTPAARFLRGL